ncbi:MAG: ABC transporter ATP-binding protein [Planctomycetota bacterium]|nr:ABC transporter ATP-binding protein [Planctomycetota bacterium]
MDLETSAEPMIEAVDLCKYYGSFAAIDHLSFTIRRGEVVAFLGPNGAGKSTTMKVLTGYLAPTAGQARLCGVDVVTERARAAEKLGYLPENGPLYPEMTARELLQFFGDARGLGRRFGERLDYVTAECDLGELLDKPIGKCSKGQKQRVGMAQVLLHDPEVLILDEPTTGLDPNQIRHVRELVKKLGETRTILLSTHLFQEVEAMAGRVMLVNDGKLAFDGTPADFKSKGAGQMDQAFHALTNEN